MTFSVKNERTPYVYDMLCAWWELKGFPIYPLELLPETTLVCYSGDVPIYAICCYLTDSKVVWLGWVITNDQVPFYEKQGGLDFLISEAERIFRDMGAKMLFTTSGTRSVIDTLLINDYIVGDEQINHYWKRLN